MDPNPDLEQPEGYSKLDETDNTKPLPSLASDLTTEEMLRFLASCYEKQSVTGPIMIYEGKKDNFKGSTWKSIMDTIYKDN